MDSPWYSRITALDSGILRPLLPEAYSFLEEMLILCYSSIEYRCDPLSLSSVEMEGEQGSHTLQSLPYLYKFHSAIELNLLFTAFYLYLEEI
jgi:hypothetical protein